jgi:hypothetical protein
MTSLEARLVMTTAPESLDSGAVLRSIPIPATLAGSSFRAVLLDRSDGGYQAIHQVRRYQRSGWTTLSLSLLYQWVVDDVVTVTGKLPSEAELRA